MTQQQRHYLKLVKKDLAESQTDAQIRAIATRAVLDYWRKMGLKGKTLIDHTSTLRLKITASSYAENHALASYYIRRLEVFWNGDVMGSLLDNAALNNTGVTQCLRADPQVSG